MRTCVDGIVRREGVRPSLNGFEYGTTTYLIRKYAGTYHKGSGLSGLGRGEGYFRGDGETIYARVLVSMDSTA